MTIRNKTTGLALLALTATGANAGSIISASKSPDLHDLLVSKKAVSGEVCGTDENKQDWHQLQKQNKQQLNSKSSFANQLLKQLSAQKKSQVASAVGNGVAGRYYIPVVVHVYGSRYNCTTGSMCLTDAKIIDGLNKSNEDFLGTNTQDGPIAAEFQAIRENLNVEFVLAKTDPSGNPTTGIVRHGEQTGYGHDSNADTQISADAWDNFKYMNIYLMHDLYADGETNNSGVAWYPQLSMSQAGLSRVVYNGDYVGSNTNENFRSVLTHEFGHWLNLPHVFDGDSCSVHQEAFCSNTGDSVCDTPQIVSSSIQDNAPNCVGKPTNTENFMHYSDNYAMYTQGQVQRMTAALHGPARATLWSNDNLTATGLSEYTSNADHPWDGSGVDIAPQGTVISEFNNLSAQKGETDNYMVDIPAGTEAVAFYLDGYTEDPDMYVSKGTAPSKNGTDWVADYISFKSTGTPELVAITGPSSTETYHATVDAFTAYSNARLQVLSVDDPSLAPGYERVFLLEETGLASAKGATPKTYSLNVPADATKMVAVIPGGYEGDPDMYVSVNSVPTTSVADCKPFSAPGINEFCDLPAGGGTVNILVDPYLEYSGVTIRVYYERLAGGSTSAPTSQANGPYSGEPGATIQFSSNGSSDSDGSIVSYNWDFGDGQSSTQANPTHSYASNGNYVATLTVTDNDQLQGTDTAPVTISTVQVGYCSASGNTGYEWIASVTSGAFTHASSKEGYADNSALVIPVVEGANTFELTAGGTYTEHWAAWVDLNNDGVFDDNSEKLLTGVSGKGTVTSDIIIPPGHDGQQLRLRIAMKYNGEAAACGAIGDGEVEDYTVSVGGSSNVAPVANANGPYAALENASISFDSTGSSDSDGTIAAYAWNFGDGNTSSVANPTHSYATAGNYTATLTVTDNEGATHAATADVTITVDNGGSNVPDACATQNPVTDGRVEDGVPVCLGQSSTIWLSMADVDAHQSVAITTAHGTGNLDVFYKNGGWPSESDNSGSSTNAGNTECIYLTNASSYWSYFKITGDASGATIVVDFDTAGCR